MCKYNLKILKRQKQKYMTYIENINISRLMKESMGTYKEKYYSVYHNGTNKKINRSETVDVLI